MTDLLSIDHALAALLRRDGACLREGVARWQGRQRNWARTTPRTPTTNKPITSLSVGLKKSAALSRTQKHRNHINRRPFLGRRPLVRGPTSRVAPVKARRERARQDA